MFNQSYARGCLVKRQGEAINGIDHRDACNEPGVCSGRGGTRQLSGEVQVYTLDLPRWLHLSRTGSVIDVRSGGEMKAVRIQRFGGPEQAALEDVLVPVAGADEILVRVLAAGVAPWDALIREGKSKVSPQPPLTLGSDLAGVVEAVGANVVGISAGDEVYGVTNPQFCGARAEYAVAQAGMIAPKPTGLGFLQAASAPVIAVAAWQMLFEYAQVKRGESIMILGAAGNVGAYASQMALDAGLNVVAVARARECAIAS